MGWPGSDWARGVAAWIAAVARSISGFPDPARERGETNERVSNSVRTRKCEVIWFDWVSLCRRLDRISPNMENGIASPGPPRLRHFVGLSGGNTAQIIANGNILFRKGIRP